MNALTAATKFKFIGGNLAVDFCNTVAGPRGALKRDYLTEPLQFIGWSQQAGVLTEDEALRILTKAEREPDRAKEALTRVVHVREAIFRLLDSCRAGKNPGEQDLAILNEELSRALHRLGLTPIEDSCDPTSEGDCVPCQYEWTWIIENDDLGQPLGPIAHAAALLLTEPHGLAHVRMCPGDGCSWLFIDTSKNHSRCWCDMRDCGNRAKIRRHREKQRSAG